MSGRYFEDLAVGQPFGSGRLRVDKEQIKDSIPNHSISTKTRRCTQSSDGLAASGWHACVQLDHYPSFFLQSREAISRHSHRRVYPSRGQPTRSLSRQGFLRRGHGAPGIHHRPQRAV